MPKGPALSVAATILYLHVLIVYLIKSIVLQRYAHRVTSPCDFEKRTLSSYVKHGGWGIALLVFAALVANAVPFFSQLLGLIGGFLSGPINFVLPMILYLLAVGRHELASTGTKDEAGLSRSSTLNATKPSCIVALRAAARKVRPWEVVAMLITTSFIVLTMVIGVSDVIRQIVALNGKFGPPFACHPFDSNEAAAGTCS